jgi:hypothetical protein
VRKLGGFLADEARYNLAPATSGKLGWGFSFAEQFGFEEDGGRALASVTLNVFGFCRSP